MPIRRNDNELARKYYHILFDIDNIRTVAISPNIAEKAAQIRALHPAIKAPDAIQVAVAISSGA